MSIIYDALKKTQKKLQTKPAEPGEIQAKKKRLKLNTDSYVTRVSIALVMLTMIVVGGYTFKQHRNQVLAREKAEQVKALAATTALARKPRILDKLKINGIFVSAEYRTALINNQYISVGDEIEGLKVVEINLEQVKFFDGKRTWTLKRSV